MNKLKTPIEILRTRGFVDECDFDSFSITAQSDICEYLNSNEAHIRTCAVKKIAIENRIDCIDKLCERLRHEDKLYTKIAICDCLAKFGTHSIEPLISLLGKIGENQHKQIGNFDLNKKTYPLPRDISARTLIRIGPSVLPSMARLLATDDLLKITEAIDVIGHVSYVSRNHSLETDILHFYHQNDDVTIKWKILRAFQSFDSERVKNELEKIINDDNENPVMINEAKRSISRINERALPIRMINR
jgi:hypothetical protein